MRRICVLVLALSLIVPVAAGAATPDQDPDGVSTAIPPSRAIASLWLDSLIHVFLVQFGI